MRTWAVRDGVRPQRRRRARRRRIAAVAAAREVARRAGGLAAEFRHGNYLEADLGGPHDAAILIFEDYCALSPAQRATLLARTATALSPGAGFVFDVTAAPRFDPVESRVEDDDLMDGFWAEPPDRGVHERWTYPDLRLVLDRYMITDASGQRRFYNWMQCLTPSQVTGELESADLVVEELVGDVAGAPFNPSSPTFAVVARRR